MISRLAPIGPFPADDIVRPLAEERARINSKQYGSAGMRRTHIDLAKFLRGLATRPERLRDGNYYGLRLDATVRQFFDHMRLYNCGRKPAAAIFHPYSRLDRESMKALTDWANDVGLELCVDADSEYYPGVTLRLVLYREGEEFPLTDLA